MSSSSLVLKRTSSLHPPFNKVQPRSSAERDNSQLLHTALKAASTDIAHRLLDYASLDKLDCEASCILIALANHEYSIMNGMKPKKPIKEVQQQKEQVVVLEEVKKTPVTTMEKASTPPPPPPSSKKSKSKNDPIMLLMAAAEVVNASDSNMKKRSYRHLDSDYPHGRYYRKSEEDVTATKRIRTSPPTTPAPSYTTSDHRSSTREQSDPFSRQYHSMKQNPKIKQNALHTYITYMIYNDLAHGGAARMQQYQQQQQQQQSTYQPTTNKYSSPSYSKPAPPPPQQQQQRSDYYSSEHKPSLSSSASSAATSSLSDPPPPWFNSNNDHRPSMNSSDERSILSRPLTAFLWNNDAPLDNNGRKEVMILPPLNAPPPPPQTTKLASTFDRLPPV